MIIGSGQGSWNPLEAQAAALLTCPSSQVGCIDNKEDRDPCLCQSADLHGDSKYLVEMAVVYQVDIHSVGKQSLNGCTKMNSTLKPKI